MAATPAQRNPMTDTGGYLSPSHMADTGDYTSPSHKPHTFGSNHAQIDTAGFFSNEGVFNVAIFFPLLVLVAVSYLIFLGVFSALGYGVQVYDELEGHYGASFGLVSLGVVVLLVMYILDFSYWKGQVLLTCRNIAIGTAVVLIFIGVILSARKYPSMPICAYLLLVPAYFWLIKAKVLPDVPASEYLGTLGAAVFTVSIIGTIVFYSWAATGNWWDDELERDIGEDIGCTFQNDTQVANRGSGSGPNDAEKADEDEACLGAFMLWASPMIYSFAGLMGSVALFYLSRMVRSKTSSSARNGLRVFFTIFAMSILGLWIAASIMGAESGLANVVVTFSGAGMMILVFVIVRTLGVKEIRRMLESVAAIKKFMDSVHSDWARAFFVITCGFPFGGFLLLSMVNQIVRVRVTCCTPRPTDREECSWYLTRVFHDIVERMKEWRWASVLRKTIWWGIAFVTLIVGVGKATTLFLSWLNDVLTTFPLGATIGIFYFVGIILFLLPPVPGVPVYLFGGILIVNAAQDEWGFWTAIVVTIFIGWSLKFLAIAIQQKIIGEQLGKMVWVRKTVAINSTSIRAIELILSRPGLNLPKIFILCGGPDWPTSVLTGILGLNIWQMLLGSSPVVLQSVGPTVLAGAFLLRADDGGSWASISSLTLAVAALLQSITVMGAIYFVEKVAHDRKEELDAKPNDREVEAAEIEDLRRIKYYQFCTDWSGEGFSPIVKGMQIVAALLMMLSCYIIQFLGNRCFAQYALTDTIDEELDGNAFNIILWPHGWGALALFAASVFINFLVGSYGSHRTKSSRMKALFEEQSKGLGVVAAAGAEAE